jgi:acetyl esterase/lipase
MTNQNPIQKIGYSLLLLAMSANSSPLAAQSRLVKTTISYRSVDGHSVLADVHRPDGDAVCPVLVWIHGGALIMGNREEIHPQIRSLAEEMGYALVSIDYRLAPETKLPELIGDIEAAFQWLATDGASRFRLDVKRVVVTGGSAGGYLTLVTGYRARPRPKALVAFYGYGGLTGDWYMQPSPHPAHNPRIVTLDEARKQSDGTIVSDARRRKGNGGLIYLHYRQQGIWPREVSGFREDQLVERIAEFEPVRHVTAEFPPTFLMHGTKDTDVPFEESKAMARQLERHKVPHELKPIDNGEHGFGGGDPEQIEAAYRTMRDFVVRHLRQP